MRNKLFIVALLFIFSVGCVKETNKDSELENCFIAGFSETETKAYVDDDLSFCWNENDRISIFNGSTVNQEYRFTGQDGDKSGIFSPVSKTESSPEFSGNYAVYPYDKNIGMSKEGVLSLTIPSVQRYEENSFGKNAAVFAAVTDDISDRRLKFHSLCGYLRIRVYGGIVVKSIEVRGNNAEKLSGRCTVSLEDINEPGICFSNDSEEAITLDCGDGIVTGEFRSQAVSFWVVIPTVVFSEGFTITITDKNGLTTTHMTNIRREVVSNHIYSMKAMSQGLEDGPFITLEDDLLLTSYLGGEDEVNVWSNVDVHSEIVDGDWITKSDKGSSCFIFSSNNSLLQRVGHICFSDEEKSVSAVLEVVQTSPASSFKVSFSNQSFRVPELSGNSTNGIIDWGDGSSYQSYKSGIIHNYNDSEERHTVKVSSMGSESFTLEEVEDGIIIDISDFCRN